MSGTKVISIYCRRNVEHDGLVQVAFSDGETTKIVPATVVGGHIDCVTPCFPVGPCQVNVALNKQQFTGEWNETGDCTSM